LQTRLTG